MMLLSTIDVWYTMGMDKDRDDGMNKPTSPLWQFEMDEHVQRLVAGAEIRLPQSKRLLWTRSREVEVAPGRWTPLLHLIAKEVDPEFEPETHEVYWRDREWTNEKIDNVVVQKKEAETVKPVRVRSGTKEYQKMWRETHREHLWAYQRERQKQMREALKQVRGRVEAAKSIMTEAEAKAVASGDDLFKKLGIS